MNNQATELVKASLSWEIVTKHYNIPYKEGKNSLCPFHDDSTPSLSFSTGKRLFNCLGCEAGGDYFNFIALQENLDCKTDFREVLKKAESIAGTNYLEKENPRPKSSPKVSIKFLDPNTIQKNHSQLASHTQALGWFKNKRGISLETLKKASVGFASHTQARGKAVIHFPYQNKQGKFIQNRIREVGSGKNVMSLKDSKASIYLAPNLNGTSRVFVTEGEIDALTIFQHTNKVVGVSGSQSFRESFIDEFKHLEEIIFCGDNDQAGKTFNEQSISLIKKKYPHIKTSYIDWNGKSEKYDINDFYMSQNDRDKFIDELLKLKVEKDFQKITPMQYFGQDFACTTIHKESIIDDKKKGKILVNLPYLITSDKKRIPLNNNALYENMLIAKHLPNPNNHWSLSSVEQFLKNKNSPINLGETFKNIEAELKKYLSFEEERFYKLIPLWIMGTYFHRGMVTFPYLSLNGSKSCGKSKLLSFIGATSFQAMINVGGTAASTIRLIHSNHITCCVDEAENLGSLGDDNTQALRSIYNSGYKDGASVSKCGFKNKVEIFDSYSPKVFAGIRGLNDTTASRCILLNMPPVKNRKNFNHEINSRSKEFSNIQDQLYIHMLSDFKEVLSTYEKIISPSNNLNGRDWEIWKPILTLATIIDSKLLETMTELALDMTKKRKSSDFSAEDDIEFIEVVLAQLEKFIELNGYVPVNSIKLALVETEVDTFVELAETHEKSNRWIGSWLKRMGLIEKASVQKKVGGFNTRCYKLSKVDLIRRLEALKE